MQMFSTKTREWFLSSVGTPTEAQRMGWQAISEGRDALISLPTGSGKTLAAFLYFLDEMRRELDAGALAEGLRIVYVSPLKALGNDIRQNLERPLAGLGLSDAVRVAVRTGDTDAKARREMIEHPPHILITTPESLYLLLTSLSGRDMLKTARTVIVDELHAVLSSKRGAHLFLSLARLDALCGGHVRRVGLSATVNPPEEAARHLTGGEPCAVIVPKIEKRMELTVDVPVPDMRQLPERSVWPAIADRVIEALDHARTVLVFVDGRAGCERLALRINERAGQTLARTHHGCVSKEQRLEAERMLKSGELRVMVATSSMELGVDVGEIDLVVQVGPPPGVSALLQRLGRAGHNPGRVSRMRVYPRTAAEAIGCALVCEAAREGRIERVRAPEMCLDVLSQHLVSMAAAGAYTVDEAVEILSRAYAYRRLASEDVKAVLGMLSGDYERMDDRPVKPRVVYDRLSGRVSGDAYTRMLALSAGGTIPDRGWFAVTLPDGTRLGELDEEFVFEARLGDKFYLGAFPWKIEEITRDRVIVSPTSPEGAASPFWKGDRAARAYETGAFYGSLLSKWEDAARRSPAALRAALCAAGLTPDAAENAARVIESQLRAVGCLATDRVLVAEHFSDEAGEHQLMLHSPFGDAVNRALGMLLARRAAAATGADARAYDDDDGALICLVGGQPIPDALLPTLAATSAPDIYPVPITPNTVSNTSSRDASGAQLAFDNPAAASGARFTFINPDTAPGANCVSANANAASGARFTSINPDTKPDARHVPASANAASGAQLAFDNPVAASGARFTSINPDNAPSASLVPASANAASGAQLAFDNPVAASGAHCTSTNPDTASDADCVSASANAASGAQLAFDNPVAASGARFTSTNPDTKPGANCVSASRNAVSAARFTSINSDTKPGANCASASTNAASGAQLALDNPVAASGARFTSINSDTKPGANCVSASRNAVSAARFTSINSDTKPGANCASASTNAASGAQLAFDNPAAASGARFTSINPDTKPGAQLAFDNPVAASGARFTSINPETRPGANCASTSANAVSSAQLVFDNPVTASGARFTSINPETKPGASPVPASANAASGVQLAFDDPVAASGARFTSINPETYPGASPVPASANAASGAQLVFDNPVTGSGARFTSINPETKPGASPVPASANAASGVQLAFDDPVAASGARFTSINPETYPGASPVPASANAASGAQLAFDNPAAASGARFTSINPDTAPDVSHVPASANAASGAQLAFDSPVAPVAASGASRVPASANTALGAQVTPDNPVTASGESHVSTSANAASGARFTFTNPVAASGARFTSTNPDTAPGAQLASADPNAALGSRLASVTPDATSVPLCGAAAEVRAMLPASPMFSMAFRYNVQRALLNGVRGGRRQPLWVQRLRGAEALGAAAAHPEHPMMRETLNECADGYLDLNALTRLLSAIRAGQVRVYEVHTDAPSPLCLNLRRQVEAEMMYDTAIPSAAVTLSKEALLTLAPTEEAVKSASRPARAPRCADELHARLLSEGDLLAGEACAPAEWMDALELAGRAVYIEPGLWIARENEDEYRLALEENDAAALSRVVRRTARFHGAQTAETLSERYAVDEVRAQEALNTLCSEGILREFGGAYVHAELYESAQRMTVALNRQRVETQPARAFARMLSQRVRGVGSSAAQLAQALDSLRGCAYPAAAWEGYLLPARVANYRPQLLDEALARGEAAYRVLPAERSQLPNETRAQAAARPCGAAPSGARVSIDSSQLPGEAAVRDEAAEHPQLSGEPRAQAAARPRGAAPSGARISVDGSQLLGETVVRDEAAEYPQLSNETRAQAAARPCGAAPSSARASIDGSRLLGEAAECPQLPSETRAQAAARPYGAASSDARISVDGSQLLGEAVVRDEAAEYPQLSNETRAQAAARPCGAAPSSARASVDGSRLLSEAAECPQLPSETRAQAAARPRGAAPSGARISVDGSQLLGEATERDEAAERPQLPGETRAQAAARPCGAAPSSARVSIDGSRLPGEAAVHDEAAEHPQLSGEPRAQAAARPRDAAPSSARASIDGSQLPGEATERDEAAERPQLPGETRAQAAARPRGAAPSGARVSIDGSQLLGEATERDEAAECPQLPSETRAQAAARPRGAAPSGARVSIDGSRLPGEAAERPQLPGETRAQAAARPYGAAPSGARVSIDVSQFPGEAAVRDEAAYRVLPAERSRLPNETRAQAAARARDAAPSDARVSIDGSQLPGEAAVRDEAAYRVLPAERPQLPGETAVRVLSGERSQLSGETAARVQSGETADSRSIPAPEIDGVPADPLAASHVRGSAASAFELHAQRRGTAVLDQSGSAHPESGLRDGRAIFGERTRASRAASGERVRVQFDLPDDEGEYEPLPDDLTDMERDVLQTLTARGASFASRLPVNAGDALKSLLARGLVRADSFLPVREMLATESGNVKKTVRRRVRVMDAGRWSRVGVLPQTSAAALVERLFDRFGIVCRETAGADWNAAFGVLKHMEYAGKARRGYFVKGLSGAQFMRETDYSTITAQLRQPSGECVWLPAADPMQAWGAYLAHEEGRAFLRVPGAAVALMDGAVVAVSEKQGETLRVFDDPAAPEALRALADAFRRGAIFPALPRLLIKKYPPTAAPHLEAAGFMREMLDYTLMRRG